MHSNMRGGRDSLMSDSHHMTDSYDLSTASTDGHSSSADHHSSAADLPQSMGLGEKYQKVLQEYGKLKQQVAVLKKGVLSEQDKFKKLEESLKEKEVLIRSSFEENDMLTFNNTRLTKRVEQLIQQITDMKKTGGGSWGLGWFSGSKQEVQKLKADVDIIQEELQKKLAENESLVTQMFELRSEHDQTVVMLDRKLVDLKRTVANKEDEITSQKMRNEQLVANASLEKDNLESRLSVVEREVQKVTAQLKDKEVTLTTINRQLSLDLERTQLLFDRKIPFDDTRLMEFNAFNVPGFDRVFNLKKASMAEQGVTLLHQLSGYISAYYDAMRDRLQLSMKNTGEASKLRFVNEHLIEIFPTQSVIFRSLESSCIKSIELLRETVCRNATNVQCLADMTVTNEEQMRFTYRQIGWIFHNICCFFHKLLPYEVLSLLEESRKETCVAVLQARNFVLVSQQKRITAALHKLTTYAKLCFPMTDIPSSEGMVTPTRLSFGAEAALSRTGTTSMKHGTTGPFVLGKLLNALSTFHSATHTYASHLNSKIAQEHKAPFVSVQIKQTNDALLSSLNGALLVIGKIGEILSDYIKIVTQPSPYLVRGAEIDPRTRTIENSNLESRGRTYFAKLLRMTYSRCAITPSDESKKTAITREHFSMSPRIPYSTALSNHKEVSKFVNIRQNLMLEIQNLQSMNKSLVEEKEALTEELKSTKGFCTEMMTEIEALKQDLQTCNDNQVNSLNAFGLLHQDLSDMANPKFLSDDDISFHNQSLNNQLLSQHSSERDLLDDDDTSTPTCYDSDTLPIVKFSPGKKNATVNNHRNASDFTALCRRISSLEAELEACRAERSMFRKLLDNSGIAYPVCPDMDDALASGILDDSPPSSPQRRDVTKSIRRGYTPRSSFDEMAVDPTQAAMTTQGAIIAEQIADITRLMKMVEELQTERADLQQRLKDSERRYREDMAQMRMEMAAASNSVGNTYRNSERVSNTNTFESNMKFDEKLGVMFEEATKYAKENAVTHSSTALPLTKNLNPESITVRVTDLLGNPLDSLLISEIDRDREVCLKKFYDAQMRQILSQAEKADKEALSHLRESITFKSRSVELQQEVDRLSSVVTSKESMIRHCEDELEITRSGMDGQLKLMTEHVVSLSEQLKSYEERLSIVFNYKVLCGRCRTWNSVKWLIEHGEEGKRCRRGNHPSSFNFA